MSWGLQIIGNLNINVYLTWRSLIVQNSNTIDNLLKQFDLVNKFYLPYEQFAFLLIR